MHEILRNLGCTRETRVCPAIHALLHDPARFGELVLGFATKMYVCACVHIYIYIYIYIYYYFYIRIYSQAPLVRKDSGTAATPTRATRTCYPRKARQWREEKTQYERCTYT